MDYLEDACLDSDGNIFVTGWVGASNFPTTTSAYDQSFNYGTYDAFVSKFSSDLTTLSASTFIGGNLWDFGYAITRDSEDNIYITGHVASANYPSTAGAYDEQFNGTGGQGVGDDAFVSKFDNDLTTLMASTFLGGSAWSCGFGISFDSEENVYVAGSTNSNSHPTTRGAYDESYNGGNEVQSDIFISKLNNQLTVLSASTFLGGTSNDGGSSIVCDDEGSVYVSGFSTSNNFPTTTGAYDETHNGNWDIVISRFDDELSANPTSVQDSPQPGKFTLHQNYPNPFNPDTAIHFDLSSFAAVSINIYNIQGQLIRSLINKASYHAGSHHITWDGSDDFGKHVGSGEYFYKIKTVNFEQTKKMILIR